MTTHILEVAERMADRIGVIAGGRSSRGHARRAAPQTGKSGTSLEDTFLTLVAGDRGRREQRRHARLVRAARVPPRLARLAVDDDRRPAAPRAHGGDRHRRLRRFMHVVAIGMVAATPPCRRSRQGDLVVVSGSALLSWSLMLSQALDSVTRAFYARADLDLILSSPIVRAGSSPCASRPWRSRPSRWRRWWPRPSSTAWSCAAAALARRLRRRRRHGPHGRALAVALTIALFHRSAPSARGWWRRSWPP
jgi:hypothetical protein